MKNILLLLIMVAMCDAFAQFGSATSIKTDEIKNNSTSNIVLNPASDVIFFNATGLTLPYFDTNGELKSSTVTKMELDKLSGTNGDLVDTGSSQTITGEKTITGKMTAQSTTTGFKPCPVMDETQRNAIVSPSLGDCITNSNTNKLNVFDGSVWKSAGGGLDKWVTSNSYQIDDVVIENDELYICLNDHTSGTFVTDLSNGEWKKIAHFINASDDSNDFRIKDIKTPNLSMTKIDDDKALIETGNNNLLENPSFEHRVSFSDNDCAFSRSNSSFGIPLAATSNCTATITNPETLAYDTTNQPTIKIKNAKAGGTYKVAFQGLLLIQPTQALAFIH
jgi:hypothetical protein